MIVDAVGSPRRFRVRLAGTAVNAAVGRDLTGKFLDEAFKELVRAEAVPTYLSVYAEAMSWKQPSRDTVPLRLNNGGEARGCRTTSGGLFDPARQCLVLERRSGGVDRVGAGFVERHSTSLDGRPSRREPASIAASPLGWRMVSGR